MASDPSERIENTLDAIDEHDEIADVDRQYIFDANRQLDLLHQEYSAHRHLKLLRHGKMMAAGLDDGVLAASAENRAAAEDAVAWINRTYENEETNRDYRSALRVLGRHATGGDEVPESLEWVPTSTSSDYDPTPDPREMLTWDDHIVPMADAATNARDAAMVTLQFDAGLRGGEFKDLTLGDIQDHDHGLRLTVEGKQGRRSLLLIPSVPHVNRWLDAHPADRTDTDAPLWSKLDRVEGVSDRMISKAINKLADRADVEKDVTLTNFRKSSAAFLASRNLNQSHIEDHHGWVTGSDAAARYISVFSEASDRELARLHGVDIPEEEEADQIAPLECPRCGKETPRDEPVCVWCGQAMDQQAAAEIDATTSEANELLARMDPEQADRLLDLVDMLDDPDVRTALLDE